MKRVLSIAVLVLVANVAAAEEWTCPVVYRGKPAVGVKVGVIPVNYPAGGGKSTYGKPVFVTTDAKGIARFPKPVEGFARLFARDAQGRGGQANHFGDDDRFPPWLDLQDCVELTGRVVDASGKAVPGLKLRPLAVVPDQFARYGRSVTFPETPDWFWDGFAPAIAANGAVTLRGIPVGHGLDVAFEAPGFGSGRTRWFFGKPAELVLQKAGAIRMNFARPAGAESRDVRVLAVRAESPDRVDAQAEGTSKAGAALTLEGLPPGSYAVSFPYTGAAASFPKVAGPITVKPGETAEITVTLEPAARITAKIVDSKTGAGIAGATLFTAIVAGRDRANVTSEKSGADGKIELALPAGMLQVTPTAPDGYAVVRFTRDPFGQNATAPVPVKPGATHDFGTFSLVKKVDVAGVVVDEEDRPVAGARVSAGYSNSNYALPVSADANGAFVLKGLNPEGGVCGLTARQGERITAAPAAVDPGKPEGQVRLVASAKFAARVRVRAVDRAGKPIAGVSVTLTHSVTYLSYGSGPIGGGSGMKVAVTDDNGEFVSKVLQPGDRYTVQLELVGGRAVTTPEWLAKPGETHDFGTIVLTRPDGAVSGTVTDLAGRPLAGARVFDNADGPRPVATKTDAAGRFTLRGLNEGTAFVSASADGFRLATVLAESGKSITVQLRRPSDPPAPAPVFTDEHKTALTTLTAHLLTSMWRYHSDANDDGKMAIRAMARLDRATAGKWRDQEKSRTGGKVDLTPELDAAVREQTLLKIAKDDPDEALALLKPLAGLEGFREVCTLANKLLAEAPAKALPFAEEAVARARGLEEINRAWALAQAGELAWRAGKKEVGRKLIDEAVSIVTKLSADGLDGYRRGMVATRVALYDPALARKLIDPIRDVYEFNRYLAQACPRAAETDLALVKKWLGEFRPDNSFASRQAWQLVANRIVGTKPDEAITIARGIEDPTYHALTLAGLALRIKDRPKAVALIDEAIDRIVADPAAGYFNGGGSGTAALVLLRAREVGHPDLATLRDKVLATRPAVDPHPFARSNGPLTSDVLALALVDPATARLLLATRLEPGDLDPAVTSRHVDHLLALAVADPKAAAGPIDALIAHSVKQKKGYSHTLRTLSTALSEPDRLAQTVIRAGRFLSDAGEE